MSWKEYCKPRDSVFARNNNLTVLDLDDLLNDKIDGQKFFEENYFTNGMVTLVNHAFRHLSGETAVSSVFRLSQAMGGGKTHSMIALGLLAKDPELRRRVLEGENRIYAASNMGRARVVGFSGRDSDAIIWGDIARQLGKADEFAIFINKLGAPGPEAWRNLLKGAPTIIFLDELPPYLEVAASNAVGNSDLAVVTAAALANLFVAVAKMDNVCVVLSDLAGTNYIVGQGHLANAIQEASFDRQVHNLTNEAVRMGVPITPVNTTGDDFYHILRRKLFKTTASESKIVEVAKAYEAALKEANDMGLTSASPSGLRDRILESYPFHPEFRDLLGKFKENPGFQQTRGVIRLMQMLISALWDDNNAKGQLIHPYDFNLNNNELASYINVINPSLSSAIAHDISDRGNAVVEQIDQANGNTDASDAAKLLLLASLSTTSGAEHGLREMEIVNCLQRPGRDLSTFKANVLDKLATNAWYLHSRTDGRLFFREQQNLAAKLKSTAGHLNAEVVERKLKDRLEKDFDPQIKDCYQRVEVLSAVDVHLDLEKTTLVIVRPGNRANNLPISADWQAWWAQQEYKNRVLFLTGSRDTFQTLIDNARNSKALEDIQGELHSQNLSANDPQWQALETLRDRVTQQFNSALKEAFDVVVYPSINTSLRSTAISLDFPGNQNPEATIRQTLETAGKFTTRIDVDTFIEQAEVRLFGTATSVLWSEFKRNAAVQTNWPLHKISALDDLKARCIQRGKWRAEGNYVNKGPFAAPSPDVEIRELSTEDEGSGQTYLQITALHANTLVFETGKNNPTTASSPVVNPARFEATGLHYRFLAYDSNAPTRWSAIKSWSAKLRLKHQLKNRATHYEVELQALPAAPGIVIKYTTDGTSPANAAAATYAGPFRVPEGTRVVLAIATCAEFALNSSPSSIRIPDISDNRPTIDVNHPVTWKKLLKLDDSGLVWNCISNLEQSPGIKTNEIKLKLASGDGDVLIDYIGNRSFEVASLKETIEKLQAIVGNGTLRMTVGELYFPTGKGLLDWLRVANIPFDLNYVEQ